MSVDREGFDHEAREAKADMEEAMEFISHFSPLKPRFTQEEPCDWCVDNFAYHYGEVRTIYDDENGNDMSLDLRVWKYCPNCARQLPEVKL